MSGIKEAGEQLTLWTTSVVLQISSRRTNSVVRRIVVVWIIVDLLFAWASSCSRATERDDAIRTLERLTHVGRYCRFSGDTSPGLNHEQCTLLCVWS